jgi:AraC-like DNA-binding protein
MADFDGLEAVQYAVQTLGQQSGRLSIRSLSEQMGMSQKHLIHQFKKMVGVSPKQCARVLTLQKVLHLIDPAVPMNWSAIAHECHYYDQAHFNRDFKAFTGLTPLQYVTLRQEHFDDLQQGDNVHFVPIIG